MLSCMPSPSGWKHRVGDYNPNYPHLSIPFSYSFFRTKSWLGTNFTVDLRLLGVGRKGQTAAQLSDDLFAWNWIGFSVVALGGFLLYSGIGSTYLVNTAFRYKLGLFVPLALAWHIVGPVESQYWGRESDTPSWPNSEVWSKYCYGSAWSQQPWRFRTTKTALRLSYIRDA